MDGVFCRGEERRGGFGSVSVLRQEKGKGKEPIGG